MPLPLRKPVDDAGIPPGWMPSKVAATRMVVTPRRVRQRCKGGLAEVGLAKKVKGCWYVSPHADPRLSDIPIETDDDRYLRQIGEMHVGGFGTRYIMQAVKRRQIVIGFYAFKGRTRAGARLSVEYINKLRAERVFPCPKIPKLSRRTLRRWCDLYRKPGDEGGVRALARQPREKHPFKSIGDEAWAVFKEAVLDGTGIHVSTAYEQTRDYIMEQRLSKSPGWAWPSLRTVQAAYQARVPDALRIYVNKGPRAFVAECLPRLPRVREIKDTNGDPATT